MTVRQWTEEEDAFLVEYEGIGAAFLARSLLRSNKAVTARKAWLIKDRPEWVAAYRADILRRQRLSEAYQAANDNGATMRQIRNSCEDSWQTLSELMTLTKMTHEQAEPIWRAAYRLPAMGRRHE